MNSEGRAEYRLKKVGDNYAVMEHIIREDNNNLARRRDHAMKYRQEIHTIGGGGGGHGNFHFGKRLQ
jgi:hypothetical protein